VDQRQYKARLLPSLSIFLQKSTNFISPLEILQSSLLL
jgi:hypothetical protein